MDENENESSTAERFERAIKSEGTVTVTPEMARDWLAGFSLDKYDVDAIFTKHVGINLTEKLIGLKVEIARVVTELQDKLVDSDSLKENVQDNLVKVQEELQQSREFNRRQHKPLLEKVEKLREANRSVYRENGKLREVNFQLERYNKDLEKEAENLRIQISELNANIDHREATDLAPSQTVALMEAAFKRWSE